MKSIFEDQDKTANGSAAPAANPFVTSKLKPIVRSVVADLSTSKLPPLARMLDQAEGSVDDEQPTLMRIGRNAGLTEALGRRRVEHEDLAFARAMAKLISSGSLKPDEPKTIAPAAAARPVDIVPVGLGVFSYEELPAAFPNLRKKILTAGFVITLAISLAGIIIGRGLIGSQTASTAGETVTTENKNPVSAPAESLVRETPSADIAPQPEASVALPAAQPKTARSESVRSRRDAKPRQSSSPQRAADDDQKPAAIQTPTKAKPVPDTVATKVTRPRVVKLPE